MKVNEMKEKIYKLLDNINDEDIERAGNELLDYYKDIDDDQIVASQKYEDFLSDNDLAECEECGEIYLKDDMSYTQYDYYVCQHCYDNCEYFTCEYCGDVCRCDSSSYIENVEEYWCESCTSEHAYYCDYCGNYVSDETTEIYTTPDREHSEHWCESCFDNGNAYYCDNCGNYFVDGCGAYDEDSDEWYCDRCADRINGAVDKIHNYSFKPMPQFRTADGEDSTQQLCFFGVETETDGKYGVNRERAVKELAEILGDFFYYKNDGSLNYGFECVSHPATINYWLANKDTIKRAFDALISNDFRSHQTTTCGYHIHASRAYLGNTYNEQEATINKILLILEGFRPQVERFSRRKDFHWSEFLTDRAKNNNYIEEIEDIKNTKVIDKVKKQVTGRYAVLNLQNANTIELRVLRGTLNIETFIAGLQFFKNIIDIAKTRSEKQLNGLKWGKIINYNKDFTELKLYNKRRGIDNEALLVVTKSPKTFVVGDKVQLIGERGLSGQDAIFASIRATGKITDIYCGKYIVEMPKKEIARASKHVQQILGHGIMAGNDGNKYFVTTDATNLVRIVKEEQTEQGEE